MSATKGIEVSLTNYVAYSDPQIARDRIGHYDLSNKSIVPLSFTSGTPIEDLYQVIEVGEANIMASGNPFPASLVKILPPITGRDILCVGKNYAEHAKEFNSSGFDSSDKVDQPSHPVIFTKRFTSIIADGEDIYPHPEFTQTADYEGEIGVIIGKAGFRINERDAMDHVWGYTIINDMTARERQRDHKQFYIGKSPDTFCPMGPIAVPASKLDKVLRIQTLVNGEPRQNATTEDLIFSIPVLIRTMSEGQTLMPGDVLATGTPAGVGIGRSPPIYLKPGDTVAVSISGLGTLTNKVANLDSQNLTINRVQRLSHIQQSNKAKDPSGTSLTTINGKSLYVKSLGESSKPPVVFVHGLGGSSELFKPLIQALGLEQSQSLNLWDLEGHGLSPTSPLSTLSIDSFTDDLHGVFEYANITSDATLIAHSMGCLVAVQYALRYSDRISKLILIGPPPSPLSEIASNGLIARAEIVRKHGVLAVADEIVAASISKNSKASSPITETAVRLSLLGQDPEGYAKACTALANAKTLDFSGIKSQTLILTGSEDGISTISLCEKYSKDLREHATLRVLNNVGHWPVLEDLQGVAGAVSEFIS